MRCWVVAAALALPALTACSDQAPRDASGEVTASGEVNAFQVRVGDCWSDTPGTAEEIKSLPTIPCEQAHLLEVFAVADFADGTFDGDDFPGQDVVAKAAETECVAAFKDFVGVPYDQSRLSVFYLHPLETSWALGDREYVCAVGQESFTTGTLRDSGV